MRELSQQFCLQETHAISLLVIVLSLAWPHQAPANPFELYGVGSRASALGNIGASNADDYTAVHYNPAALVSGESSLGGDFSYAA